MLEQQDKIPVTHQQPLSVKNERELLIDKQVNPVDTNISLLTWFNSVLKLFNALMEFLYYSLVYSNLLVNSLFSGKIVFWLGNLFLVVKLVFVAMMFCFILKFLKHVFFFSWTGSNY